MYKYKTIDLKMLIIYRNDIFSVFFCKIYYLQLKYTIRSGQLFSEWFLQNDG